MRNSCRVMHAFRVLVLLGIGTVSIDGTIYDITKPTEWWQTTELYQIWPRTFKDSDGNGIGDLNGVTSKLDHFVDMGIEAIWLPPFYSSPLIDSGYDVSNYTDVNPLYGTLEDFDKLVAEAKKRGLKIVIDFVPNHTSDKHQWFINSKAGIEPYTDYYVWKEGKIDANGTRQPPNNWISVFGGSAWEWVQKRQAYYLHLFSKEQPDLNLRNPMVIQETKDILTFWLDRGVDGVRLDALPFLVENASFGDQPLSNLAGAPSDRPLYLKNIYIKDQPGNYDLTKIWRDHIDNYIDKKGDGVVRATFGEAYANVTNVMKYYDYGAHIPFNFFWIRDQETEVTKIKKASDATGIIDLWMGNMPKNATANWVMGNHDNSRVATRFGSKSVDGFNFFLFLLPGVATIYNGDEIGMTDTPLTWEETEDPQACNSGRTSYELYSRDPFRTPFHWDNTTSAGFSTNPKTVLPVNPNYLELNLAAQKAAHVSHYKNVQAAIKLRSTKVIREGSLDVQVIDDLVIAFARKLDGEQPIVVLMNWDDTTAIEISLEVIADLPDALEVLIADIYSGIVVGEVYKKTHVYLPPKAAVVLRGIDGFDHEEKIHAPPKAHTY